MKYCGEGNSFPKDEVDRYVIVCHIPSKRAFTLNRNYQLNSDDFADYSLLSFHYEDEWEAWLPSYQYQRPNWAETLQIRDFVAYWLY